MTKTNKEIADHLYHFSDLLEASGDSPYRIRAYRRAARSILAFPSNLSELIAQDFDLTSIPWVGKGIAALIKQIVIDNRLPEIRTQQRKIIKNQLPSLPGLGKKRVKILNEEYNIFTAKELFLAYEQGKLTKLTWIKEPFIQRIKHYTPHPHSPTKFLRLYHALPVVELIRNRLSTLSDVKFVACCGDFRRKKEVVDHLDFIVSTNQPKLVIEHFLTFHQVLHLLHQEKNKVIVELWCGINMILKCVPSHSLGATLLYATGNKKHLNQLERLAVEHDYLLNERGLFQNKQPIARKTEDEIYNSLNLAYIEPELREGKDEIFAAQNDDLPKLIELKDIKGDLHSHTNETDGKESLELMVNAAAERGYEYFAITDHSKHLAITNGLDEKRLLKQIKEIDKLNSQLCNVRILKSIEVDILADGSLDLSNDVLKELDLVVCSIHSQFRIPEAKQTERILRAMDNPYFNILGHATGRLIKSRPPYEINIERIIQAAKDHGCFIELNAQPYRLDINDVYCKLAKDKGVKLAISSDAHSRRELNFMQMGIFQARRGWLEARDVINTYHWSDLQKLLKRN